MSWWVRLWRWLIELFGPRPLRTVLVAEVPEAPRRGEAYLVGENGHYWCAALLCPCGCGELIQLNLTPDTRPCWTFRVDSGGGLTLNPSVWRTKGCRSHFFLRGGRVDHCPEGTSSSDAGGTTWVG